MSEVLRITLSGYASLTRPTYLPQLADLAAGRAVSRRYRNRRIGEFLKELELTESCSTGIQKKPTRMTSKTWAAALWLTVGRVSEA